MIVALDKIRGALEDVGSSMENSVKTVIYLKHVEEYKVMRQTERVLAKVCSPLAGGATSQYLYATCFSSQTQYAGGDRCNSRHPDITATTDRRLSLDE